MPGFRQTLHLLLVAGCFFLNVSTLPAREAIARTFGKPLTLKKTLSLQEALQQPAKYQGQKVLLEGKISDVCQMKGCWLMLSDGGRAIRMKFEGYSFFVPRDCRGKKVQAEGRLIQETLSQEMARHYAEEQSAQANQSQIKGPQRVVTFEAVGVTIFD
ncbi:MAG: DUF4920 domain-containing protein [Acidobacteria bacterium]|nr:DUF4920 domain-containing protein [Acidobacteriota bacterium]MCI0724341.1 DUF4920 domain-containing protein [Acidobacteriota bacterium]